MEKNKNKGEGFYLNVLRQLYKIYHVRGGSSMLWKNVRETHKFSSQLKGVLTNLGYFKSSGSRRYPVLEWVGPEPTPVLERTVVKIMRKNLTKDNKLKMIIPVNAKIAGERQRVADLELKFFNLEKEHKLINKKLDQIRAILA